MTLNWCRSGAWGYFVEEKWFFLRRWAGGVALTDDKPCVTNILGLNCTLHSGRITPLEKYFGQKYIYTWQGLCPLLLFIIYVFRTICVHILCSLPVSVQYYKTYIYIVLIYSVFLRKKKTSGYVYMPSAVNNFQKIIQFIYCESDKL